MKIKLKCTNAFKTKLVLNGLSQCEYARKIGISAPYANQIANGSRNPSPAVALRTIKLLKVNFNDIFFIDVACNSNQKNL